MALGSPKINKALVVEFMDSMGDLRKVMMEIMANQEDGLMTGLQFRALKSIRETPGMTAGELGKQSMMSSAATAQFINRLTNSGWIEKRVDDEDKRVVHLFLTESGEKEIHAMRKIFEKKIAGLLSFLPAEDVKDLIRIQKKLLHNLNQNVKNS